MVIYKKLNKEEKMDNSKQNKTKSFLKSTVKFVAGMFLFSVMALAVIAMYLIVV